jgi:hypothetical protein
MSLAQDEIVAEVGPGGVQQVVPRATLLELNATRREESEPGLARALTRCALAEIPAHWPDWPKEQVSEIVVRLVEWPY